MHRAPQRELRSCCTNLPFRNTPQEPELYVGVLAIWQESNDSDLCSEGTGKPHAPFTRFATRA